MLKWSASAQKLPPPETPGTITLRTPRPSEAKKRRRRATIANKENIPCTSTPMVQQRLRNSPLVLAPLKDILNITPEPPAERTPERVTHTRVSGSTQRRHSTIGITLPSGVQYAATLPRFEEEYSPSAALPTGQQLAMRGLLPDPFMGNARYFTTPELFKTEKINKHKKSLPNKRRLEAEFTQLAAEEASKAAKKPDVANTTGLVSAKMGDQTLDKLIDAILDSACKEEKKNKKPRKSFNLRRRTLLKNQVDTVNDLMLSPSYAPGDDPASDLSFLLMEPTVSATTHFNTFTPQPASSMPPTPHPATPPPGTPIPAELLQQMPTPHPSSSPLHAKNDSFMLATPVRSLAQKRQRRARQLESQTVESPSKRFKVDARNYFEIGLALPSIYV